MSTLKNIFPLTKAERRRKRKKKEKRKKERQLLENQIVDTQRIIDGTQHQLPEKQIVDVPKEQKIVDAPKQRQIVDTPKEQRKVDTQHQIVDGTQKQQKVDTPKEQRKIVDTPKQHKIVDAPKERKIVDVPKEQNEKLFVVNFSPAHAAKLIELHNGKSIVLQSSDEFKYKVSLYYGSYNLPVMSYSKLVTPDIIISTTDDNINEFPYNERRVLLKMNELGSKYEKIHDFDEIYQSLTPAYKKEHKKKNLIETKYPPIAKILYDWKKKFAQNYDFYKANYINLPYEKVHQFIKLYPYVVKEDGLFWINGKFANYDKYRNEKLYKILVQINRELHITNTLPTKKLQPKYSNVNIDYEVVSDGREYNSLLMSEKRIRETIVYEAAKHYKVCPVELDFNSMFPHLNLIKSGVINKKSYIDFKNLTDAGKSLKPDDVLNEKTSEKTKNEFKEAHKEGGSAALCKIYINAVFNGYQSKLKYKQPSRSVVEKTLKELVNFDWNIYANFDNFDSRINFSVCAKAEAFCRQRLIEEVSKYLPDNKRLMQFSVNDGIIAFFEKDIADLICRKQTDKVVIDKDYTVKYADLQYTLPYGAEFTYKIRSDFGHRFKVWGDFLNYMKIVDSEWYMYHTTIGKNKNKAVGKNKHTSIYVSNTERYRGIFTEDEFKELNTYNFADMSKNIKDMCFKKIKVNNNVAKKLGDYFSDKVDDYVADYLAKNVGDNLADNVTVNVGDCFDDNVGLCDNVYYLPDDFYALNNIRYIDY